jgi:glutamate-1-semialdehyde 2,1-aminomutase
VKPWEERLIESAPGSKRTYERAQSVLAGGRTHEARFIDPFPISVSRAAGSRKWDVDGNEYVDFVLGNGALLLGHSHPEVVEAAQKQIALGTHYGAAHELEVEWAESVQRLVPSAERVRFTSSGTEAVMLAVRAARAFTRRPAIIKFQRHFHGWSEIGLTGFMEPFDTPLAGIIQPPPTEIVAIDPNDFALLDRLLAQGDVAAVIVEPSGPHFGHVPLREGFHQELRELTRRRDVLLIFDEVITGFRWAVGGAQERYGVNADLTTYGKILGGGLPAGALAGRADVLDAFNITGDVERDRLEHLFHPGTFNANPVSAAAGVACLSIVETGEPIRVADKLTEELRGELNRVLSESGIPGLIYGEASAFHIYLGEVPDSIEERERALAQMRGPIAKSVRSALLAEGIDLISSGGMLSSAHTPDDLEIAVTGFRKALKELTASGVV